MRDLKIRRLVVKNNVGVVGVISETDILRVEPELHLLIREHARLHLPSSDYSDAKENFSGIVRSAITIQVLKILMVDGFAKSANNLQKNH